MSDGHKARSSEDRTRDGGARESAPESAGPRVVGSIETVPGYRKRTPPASPARAGQGGGALEGLAWPAPTPTAAPTPSPRPRDSAAGAFGRAGALEVVIGDDDRQVVPDVSVSPWRAICALRIATADGQPFVGTGWFIGPRTIMTAAHCVYLHDHGGWPASIEVIPALNGNLRPYGSARGSRFRAVDGWIDNQDPNTDYGAILLDEPLGDTTGWFAFSVLGDADLSGNEANIAGYPADRDQASRQYYHARTISRATPTQVYYEIDTYGGQSGSAIWLKVGEQRTAIGVHTTGSSLGNSGVRISREVFDNMRRWKQEP